MKPRWIVLTCAVVLALWAGGTQVMAQDKDAPKPETPAGAEVKAADPAAPEAPKAEEKPAEEPAPATPPKPINSGHQAWMLTSSALVLLMTPGLAFFYGGLVRRKNVLSVLMQCFMCMAIVTVLWVVVGFSMAFGDNVGGFLGGFMGNPRQYFMLDTIEFNEPWFPVTTFSSEISEQVFMVFQCMFAIITPALIIGAFAERMKFSAFTVFIAAWLLLVYCPVAHWVWYGPGGFFGLGNFDKDAMPVGALDFAGGTVVHINAGIAALVACLVMGKRQGFAQGKISPPHNLPFAVLGAGMLWFGWFGFNGGSAIFANDQAARAFVVTHVAAAAAGLAWSLIEWVRNGHPTVLGMITGAVAGLVAITPASGFVDVSSALIIGGVASVISYIFVACIKPALGYDDSLDVFGVHCMSGIWGAIATGFFAVKGFGENLAGGWIETGSMNQVLLQAKAVSYTLVYSGVATFVILMVIKAVIGLKAEEQDERVGLDLTDHSEAAYTLVE